MHTSRQYDHALEVLGEAFDQDREKLPNVIVKLGGGTTDDIRATITDNLAPLGLESITIGQLNPVGQLADDLVWGGPMIAELQQIREEGRIGRAGQLDGLVDGLITYLNPLQRFGSNELWDELIDRDRSITSMRTVCGAHVHALRDVPGADW